MEPEKSMIVTKKYYDNWQAVLGLYNELEKENRRLEAENKKLKKREDEFFEHAYNGYVMETREELEELAEGWENKNSLCVAIHQMWKREPKVKELEAENKAFRAFNSIELDKPPTERELCIGCSLPSENKRLREALSPFVKFLEEERDIPANPLPGSSCSQWPLPGLIFADFLIAEQALKGK